MITYGNYDESGDDWMEEFTRRRLGLPALIDGRTVPASLAHLAGTAIPSIEKERDKYAAEYQRLAPQLAELQTETDAALAKFQNAVEQLLLIREFQNKMEDLS